MKPTLPITLDHIGIAVKDLPGLERLFALLGLTKNHSETVPEQGVNTHFIPTPPTGTTLELLEPTDPTGTVAQFLAKRGPGIHHLSFSLAPGTLESTCAKLKESGYRLIYESPKDGAHGMRINFIHPSTAGGLLIELMEPRK